MHRRLVHHGHQELVVRAEGDAEMRAGPFQEFRLRRHVGKPQRHTVVMGNREAQALGRKGETTHRRRHIEGLFFALAAANEGGLAGRPRHSAVGMQCYIVDPAPLRIGRQHRHRALGIECNDLAVIAAGDDTFAVGSRAQNDAAVKGDRRDVAGRTDQRRVLLGADEHRGVAEKMNRGDRHADGKRTHPVGDGSDGGAVARIKLFHHVVIQLSKPSRIICSGNSRPMKTTRLSRASPSFHLRWWSPSSIMCTPWNT